MCIPAHNMGHEVAQSVDALRYKLEGRGFDYSRWCHWNFSLTYNFRPHCGPGVDSVFKRSEYQENFGGRGKGGGCVWLTTLPPSCAACLDIWKPQPPGIFRVCPGMYSDYFTFTFTFTCKQYHVIIHSLSDDPHTNSSSLTQQLPQQ